MYTLRVKITSIYMVNIFCSYFHIFYTHQVKLFISLKHYQTTQIIALHTIF